MQVHRLWSWKQTIQEQVSITFHQISVTELPLVFKHSLGADFDTKMTWVTSYNQARLTFTNDTDKTSIEEEFKYWESESKITKGYLITFTACEVILVSYPSLILVSVVLCSCLLFLKKFRGAAGGHLGVLDGEDVDTQYLLTACSGKVIKEMDTHEEVVKQGETQEISLEEN